MVRTPALALAACLLCVGGLRADDTAAADDAAHAHTPLTVDSPPIISRLKVAFARPRRVEVTSTGHVLIADWQAGVVFRVAPDGITSVLADGLNEPAGLSLDGDGNVYICTHAKGLTNGGSVYKVTPGGERELVHRDLTAPIDLVRDQFGNTFVTSLKNNNVVRIEPDGTRRVLTRGILRPTAIAQGRDGELYVAGSERGRVYQLSPTDGELRIVAEGLKSPSDIACTHDGRVVIADLQARRLGVVGADGELGDYARVPDGTVALAFTPEGNLLVANWNLQSVTRVTSRLSVPCPHCGQPIPLLLKRSPPRRVSF